MHSRRNYAKSLYHTGVKIFQVLFVLVFTFSLLGVQPVKPVQAATTVNLSSAGETYLRQGSPTRNYGGTVTVSVSNGTYKQNSLYKWDLSTIPEGSTVTSASITFRVTDASTADFSIFAIRRAWVEGNSNDAESSTSANYNTYDGVNTWGTAGAMSTTLDRFTTDLWDATGGSGGTFSATGDVTIPLNASGVEAVQGWVTSPSSNHGLTMQFTGTAGTSDYWIVASKENTSGYTAPTLNVTYEAAGPTIITSVSSLAPFATPPGTPSAVQTYTVSGVNLTDSIDIGGVSGFVTSLDGTNWVDPIEDFISINPTGGVVLSTTIYVRMTGAAEGEFSGTIAHVSSGAGTKNVAVSGKVSNEICVTSRISAGSDDAEERTDTNAVDLDGSTTGKYLQMYRAYGGTGGTVTNYWGLRFTSVNVPQGATITSADVTFRADATNATATSMTLWGQAADNPTTFTTVASNISSMTTRPRTTATTVWSVEGWISGSDYLTPDLSSIVQEIVNRTGWAANNALVIAGEATVNQNRTALSYDSTNGATLAPLLEVCYTLSTDPTITTSGTLAAFTTTPGLPSEEQIYTVSGLNLTGNLVITPPPGFQISTTSGSGFGSSVSLTPISGTVAATPIYVRLYNATVGSFSGNITHISTDATPKNVPVEGEVTNQVCYTDEAFVSVADTYMSGFNSTNNYGGQTYMRVTLGTTQQRGALIRWDLSSLPTDAVISNPRLQLYVSTQGSATYNLYNMRRAWVEGTQSGAVPASGAGATFATYDGNTANTWGTGGAANTTTDRYATNLWGAGSSSFSTTGSKTVVLNNDGLAVVQGWVDGSLPNYGFTIQNYTTGSTDVQFSTKDHATEANRPRLVIDYCVGGPANSAPNTPVLVQPGDNATSVALPPTLEVTVTDPDGDLMDVEFWGRPVSTETPSEDFLFIAIPDTQNLSTNYPTTMSNQFDWIADRFVANATNPVDLKFVTGLGDIVNSSSNTTEWARADTAYDFLDAANVPYSVGPGNHDLGGLYNTYFGPSRFTGKSYYQGSYAAGANENNYSFFSAGGMDFILINLQYSPTSAILDWADALLKANSDRRGIVEQHNILNTDNSWNSQTSFTALKDNPNLFLMLCGHMHSGSDGSAYRAELGDDGHTIHILLTDYQDLSDNDYLRLLTFKPAMDEIYAQVYSPVKLGTYRTDASNYEQFTMAYDMEGTAAAPFILIGTDTEVSSGENASISWTGLANNTEYEWYVVVSDGGLSTSTESTPWSFTTQGVPNNAPTDITLSGASIAENAAANTTVGTLSSSDPDAGNTFTYTLVTGTGSTDNASFNILDNMLRATAAFNYEAKNSYSVRIRTTDQGGLYYEEPFTITVTNVNEAPTDIALSVSTVAENQPVNTVVGTLSSTDPDAGSSFTYSIVGGDTTAFNVLESSLRTSAVFDFETKSSYTVTIRTSDGSLTYDKAFTITVTNVNEAPVAVADSYSTLQSTQRVVDAPGVLANDSDVDSITITAILVDGVSHGLFELHADGSFVYTPTAGYNGPDSFTYKANDGELDSNTVTVSITVTSTNEAPTDIALDNNTVAENGAANSVVGTLSSTDPDTGNTFTYTLVTGTGSTDNASFNILGDSLRATAAFDYETKSSYSVRIRTTDGGGLYYEKAFTITVTDVNETPTDIALSASTIAENSAANTVVGTLSSTDPDAGASFTYTLVSGTGDTDNASFTTSGNSLRTSAVFDFETKSSYSIRVRTTDGGGLYYEESFTITVTDLNEAPTDIALSANAVVENAAANTVVGTLSSTDPDTGNTFTYTLVSGIGDTDNASFNILNDSLRATAAFDYETKNSYSVRIRTTDGGGLFHEEAFTITVTNVNEAPTNIALSVSTVAENQPVNTEVGILSSTDPDTGDSFTYSIVGGDTTAFNVSGSSLRTSSVFDYETKSSYTVTIRTTDSGSLTYDKAFSITITDVVEAPPCTTVNLVAAEDTYMSAYNDDYNYGSVNLLKVTNYYSSIPNRGALLKWDVSSIPSDSTISSASLKLYVSTAGAKVYNLYNMRRAWVEGTLTTGATSNTSANWNTYNGVDAWGTAGAANTTTDRYDLNMWDADATTFVSTGSKTVDLNANGIAAIQGWITGTNYGVTIQNYATSGSNDDLQISSSENTTVTNRPTLNVTYCVSSTDPTISVTSSMTSFSAPVNEYSDVQSYNVTGANLTADIIVTAPANFEVSLTSGGDFASSVTLPSVGGTIYVRFKATAEGTTTANINHTSTGADPKTLSVSGTAYNVYTLTVTNDGNGSVTLNPTGGSYAAGTTVTLTPVPTTGFVFDNWSGANAGDIINTAGVFTIVMNENKSLTATFTEAPPWTAYNDVSGTSTPANTTEWTLDQVDGMLKDFDSGEDTGVTVTITKSNTLMNNTSLGSMPDSGTDAYTTFNGKVNLQGVVQYNATGTVEDFWMDLTFEGLDPAKTYTFVTTANRAGGTGGSTDPAYTIRNTRYTISGMVSATNASSAGTSLYEGNPYAVYFVTGENTTNGYVARWINIKPSAEGTFTVRAQPNDEVIKTYAFGAFMLQEEVSVTPDIEITGFEAITAIQAGEAGSALSLEEVQDLLPESAMATTASATVSIPVTGWVNTDSYDPDVPGSYTFTATLGTIPDGYANSGNYTATIEVVVTGVSDIEITGFEAITAIQAGEAGSALSLAAVQDLLPESAMATTASGTVSVPVAAWVDTDSYNPSVPGSYTFTATLGTIPDGYANTGNYTATIEVVVSVPPVGFTIYLPLIFK